MNFGRVDQIAKAVLYEGYMLYPYRPSSVKNQQRWNFGVLYPVAYSEAQGGVEQCSLRTECLVVGSAATVVELTLRFLHFYTRAATNQELQGELVSDPWQEAIEKTVKLPAHLLSSFLGRPVGHPFSVAGELNAIIADNGESGSATSALHQRAIEGVIEVAAEAIRQDIFKLSILIRNTTPLPEPPPARDTALMHSMVSAHVVMGVKDGEFVSLLEPPTDLQECTSRCQNVGVWPVLVGDSGQRDIMLASPIILYDYPQIAPESACDLFDGTEIDEILSLRIMTLTDEEKREIRQSDDRARQILERTDAMPAEHFMKLHGVVRGMRPLKENNP